MLEKHAYSCSDKIFWKAQKRVMVPETERKVPPPLQCGWDLAQKELLDPGCGCLVLPPGPVPAAAFTWWGRLGNWPDRKIPFLPWIFTSVIPRANYFWGHRNVSAGEKRQQDRTVWSRPDHPSGILWPWSHTHRLWPQVNDNRRIRFVIEIP